MEEEHEEKNTRTEKYNYRRGENNEREKVTWSKKKGERLADRSPNERPKRTLGAPYPYESLRKKRKEKKRKESEGKGEVRE